MTAWGQLAPYAWGQLYFWGSPLPPTLTATVQTTSSNGTPVARVQLVLAWPGIGTVTVARQDPDGVWRPVRNAEAVTVGDAAAWFDHEAPLDQPVTYRATTAGQTYVAYSVAVTVPSGAKAWLSHPGWPAYGRSVTANDLSEQYPIRRGVFTAIGAPLPVAVSDVRDGAVGTITIQVSTAADITRLRAMLADGQPLLLRQPATWGGDTWYVSIDTAAVDRFTRIATDAWRRWTLPYIRVDRPPGLSAGAIGVTCDDVTATYATCTALAAAKATCTALETSVV